MLRIVDGILNSITMYRLVLYGLIFLSSLSIIFSFLNIIPFQPTALLVSLVTLIIVCSTTNLLFSKIFHAPINIESSYITALILFLILLPSTQPNQILMVAMAGIIAMGSKYILAINKKHIFNPAALSLVVMAISGNHIGSWWITTSIMTPFVLIVGFLVVRKLRRFHLLLSFAAVNFVFLIFFRISSGAEITELLRIFTTWPALFFATIMLTEPLTTPPTKRLQILYGALIAILVSLPFKVGPIYFTAENALIVGNIFAFFVSSKQRYILTLQNKTKLTDNIYEFVFKTQKKINFTPGEYFEWTLPHKKTDMRGNRRFFTIASSPTEENIKLGVKIESERSSSFKKALKELKSGDKIAAGSLSGDFVLNPKLKQKLVFIAGGIGITPFRSIIKFLIDKNRAEDIILFYACANPSEFVYQDIFDEAKKNGIKTLYIATHKESLPKNWTGLTGHIDENMIINNVPEYKNRTYYISGPNSMVDAYKKLLKKIGINGNHIITDYFPGY